MKLYKYYSFDDNKNFDTNFAPLIRKSIRYSAPILFNDLYDCKCVQKNLDGSITSDFTEVISKHLQISCFSINPNSPIMWAHYASNHKGYILEYELDLEDLTKISYEELNPKFFDITKIKNELMELHPNVSTESDEFFKLQEKYLLDNKECQAILSDSIFIKHNDWKYEEEYRSIIVNENGFEANTTDKMIEEDNIVSIILGYRFDNKYNIQLEEINEKYFDSKLIIYNAFPRLDSYFIDFKEYKNT